MEILKDDNVPYSYLPAGRYPHPLDRMLSGPQAQAAHKDPPLAPPRSAPSATSQKLLWDGLTDFERIRQQELEEVRRISNV